MKHCKYCNAELPEGSNFCPSCGKKVTPGGPSGKTLAAIVVAVFLVVCVLLSVGSIGSLFSVKSASTSTSAAVMKSDSSTEPSAEATEAATQESTEEVTEETAEEVTEETSAEATEEATEAPTEEATVPADGNPDDVTCKGTYTAEDDAVIAARDTVVATAGEYELTLGQLQVFYWMEFRNFMYQYGTYASYFSLDPYQSLDTQTCPIETVDRTWQQFFLESALKSWRNYCAIAAEADANGYELTETQTDNLENVVEKLEETAVANGYESGDAMLHASLGAGAEAEDYAYYMELYYKANGYYSQVANSIEATDEELDAYFEEHADEYSESGITKESKSVDVRHILIFPEGADSSTVTTEEFSDEAWAYAETTAQSILDKFLAGEQTEDAFATLANENSQDSGSNTNGGLYEGVTEGEMVEAFNDWCFDESRQVGDTGIVKTEYGYHVMYYSGSSLLWKEYALSDYVSEQASAFITEATADYPLTVTYSDILLASSVIE